MNERQAGKSTAKARRWGSARKAAGILLAVVLAGGALPHLVAGRPSDPPAAGADAIFVLTGGENRIAEGFRAWREGRGKALFILGAGPEARLEQVLPGYHELAREDRQRVHLEVWSRNTFENAISAKSFVMANGYRSVILVTSDYHMPRARLAFLRVLPADVAMSVRPVSSMGKWQIVPLKTVRLFLVEGWKYWWYRLFLLWE